MAQLLLPQILIVPSSAGHRAFEGRDGEMGEGAMLGSHADGVRWPVLPVLVQPLLRAELQEELSGSHRHPTGRDHRGGRHRDTTQLVLP